MYQLFPVSVHQYWFYLFYKCYRRDLLKVMLNFCKWHKPFRDIHIVLELFFEICNCFGFICHPNVQVVNWIVLFFWWKVFASFAAAAIKIRTSALYSSSVNKDGDQSISQYKYGMVLKETMLNLGPTFIKGIKQNIDESQYYILDFEMCRLFCPRWIILWIIHTVPYYFSAVKTLPILFWHAYAVGQSLSTRPDIIGSEITKVSQDPFC